MLRLFCSWACSAGRAATFATFQVVRDGSAAPANELRVMLAHRHCLATGKITWARNIVAGMKLMQQDGGTQGLPPHPTLHSLHMTHSGHCAVMIPHPYHSKSVRNAQGPASGCSGCRLSLRSHRCPLGQRSETQPPNHYPQLPLPAHLYSDYCIALLTGCERAAPPPTTPQPLISPRFRCDPNPSCPSHFRLSFCTP